MAWEDKGKCITMLAAADLSSYQFHFVKISADNTVNICSGATDVPCGVLQNKPDGAGKAAEVLVYGVSKVMAGTGAALSAGDLIGTDSNGEAEAKTPGSDVTNYVVGQVVEGTTNASEVGSAMINCQNPQRAA